MPGVCKPSLGPWGPGCGVAVELSGLLERTGAGCMWLLPGWSRPEMLEAVGDSDSRYAKLPLDEAGMLPSARGAPAHVWGTGCLAGCQ